MSATVELTPTDGKRPLLSIDMSEESGRKDWTHRCQRLGVRPAAKGDQAKKKKKTFRLGRRLIDNDNVLFLSREPGEKDDSIYKMSADGKNLKRLIKNGRFPSVSAP